MLHRAARLADLPAAGQPGQRVHVNLPAGSGVGTTPGSQYNDILAIQVAGTGSLPVNDRGTHGFIFDSPANQARASFLHPALPVGASNTDVGMMDGYEVLFQYDWCGVPMTLARSEPDRTRRPDDGLRRRATCHARARRAAAGRATRPRSR